MTTEAELGVEELRKLADKAMQAGASVQLVAKSKIEHGIRWRTEALEQEDLSGERRASLAQEIDEIRTFQLVENAPPPADR